MQSNKIVKKILKIGLLALISVIFITFFINAYVCLSVKNQIKNNFNNDYDAILVLGAGVRGNSPSPMLKERLDSAIELYKKGVSKKIIMSGDHGRIEYDEVNIMKAYAIENGVPSEDIFMDHAGFSTYDSIYRAKEIFAVNKIVIVTQKFHLYRAIYIANKLNLNAYGYDAQKRRFSGQFIRDIREFLARNKDFIKCIIKPKSTYLGDKIPVNGNGDITNDK